MKKEEIRALFELNQENIREEIMSAIGQLPEVPFEDTEITVTGVDGLHFRFDYDIKICYVLEDPKDPESDIVLKNLILNRITVIDKIRHDVGYEDFHEDLLKRI